MRPGAATDLDRIIEPATTSRLALGGADRPILRFQAWRPIAANALTVSLGLALVPQMIGHNVAIWALRHRRPMTVSLVWLGEPAVAALLTYMLWDEVPAVLTIAGALLVLPGVAYAVAAGAEPAARTDATTGEEK